MICHREEVEDRRGDPEHISGLLRRFTSRNDDLENIMEKKIRILIGKPGLDGHDRGAKIIARTLRDAGYEVIYSGLHQTPEMIVNTAIQEDVDALSLIHI